MTTDRVIACGKAAALAAGVLAAWFALLAAGTAMTAPGQVLVLGPHAVESAARADGRVTVAGKVFAQARSEEAGFVGRLYANGAWLVLPAAGGGCRGAAPRG